MCLSSGVFVWSSSFYWSSRAAGFTKLAFRLRLPPPSLLHGDVEQRHPVFDLLARSRPLTKEPMPTIFPRLFTDPVPYPLLFRMTNRLFSLPPRLLSERSPPVGSSLDKVPAPNSFCMPKMRLARSMSGSGRLTPTIHLVPRAAFFHGERQGSPKGSHREAYRDSEAFQCV